MTVSVKNDHIHHFDKLTLQKVQLRSADGTISGLDVLKHRACSCGAVQTYDVVRAKVY